MNRITSFLQPSIHESQTLFSPDLLSPSIHPHCPTPIPAPVPHRHILSLPCNTSIQENCRLHFYLTGLQFSSILNPYFNIQTKISSFHDRNQKNNIIFLNILRLTYVLPSPFPLNFYSSFNDQTYCYLTFLQLLS